MLLHGLIEVGPASGQWLATPVGAGFRQKLDGPVVQPTDGSFGIEKDQPITRDQQKTRQPGAPGGGWLVTTAADDQRGLPGLEFRPIC